MLRKIRQTVALCCFMLVTLLFLDFTGTAHAWFGWLAKVQFLPAVLALNAVVIAFLIAATLLFGRIYCSVICPLGVFQDLVARIGTRGKKLPYAYSSSRPWLRYGFLALFIVAFVAGGSVFVALLDPYSAYGRMVGNLLQPLWIWGNNVLAHLAERAGSYAFYESSVWLKSMAVLVTAVVTLAVVGFLAFRYGRTYCNTVCPVGTVLGLLSRYSFFRIVIDTDKCNGCGVCARNCKASCIDPKEHLVDGSRCVACMNCIGKCRKEAIGYRWKKATFRKESLLHEERLPVDQTTPSANNTDGRRGFLSVAALLVAAGIKSQIVPKEVKTKMDGGLAEILDRKLPTRQTPLSPPGSETARNLKKHCTACQLCISACPNNVLRPSSDLETLMQPVMAYDRGYCRPECTRCSEVCPTGAIRTISQEDKSSLQIGHAVWVKENCVPLTDGVRCGNCARHCPVGAIRMIESEPGNPDSLRIPAVNTERCIGCGACENLCPARPFGAIYVEGHERHKTV